MNNKLFCVLIVVVTLPTIFGCAESKSVEELRKEFDGVFLLDGKRYGEPQKSLHYIVFAQDSTYIHTYICDGDTLSHIGKWKIGSYKDGRIFFWVTDWIPYGKDPNRDSHLNPGIQILGGYKNSDYLALRFHIDCGYEFEKISSDQAKKLGIKE